MPEADISSSVSSDTTSQSLQRSRTIGTILVEEGLLLSNDVERVQSFASERGLQFGAAAVQLKLLRQTDVNFALGRQYNYPSLPLTGYGAVSEDVIAAHDPTSKLVEPLRALRSQLTFRWLNNAKRKSLAIVSPETGDGRSWLAANLATAFAQTGQRTLLIDGDLRSPRQHVLFKLNNSTGLSGLLSGRGAADVVQRVSPSLPLFVLPAGSAPPNPQELLSHSSFSSMLERCMKNFAIVLIDTPAAAASSDAQVLAAQAGSAIMLARRNHTRSERWTAATQCLMQSGVAVIGSVVNEY